MPKAAVKTAQDIQDDIFRRMTVTEKVNLTWDFSRHLEDIESVLKISKINKNYLLKEAERQSNAQILEKILK